MKILSEAGEGRGGAGSKRRVTDRAKGELARAQSEEYLDKLEELGKNNYLKSKEFQKSSFRKRSLLPLKTLPSHPWFQPHLKRKPHLQKCFCCGQKGHRVSSCSNNMVCLYCELDDNCAADCPFTDPSQPHHEAPAPPQPHPQPSRSSLGPLLPLPRQPPLHNRAKQPLVHRKPLLAHRSSHPHKQHRNKPSNNPLRRSSPPLHQPSRSRPTPLNSSTSLHCTPNKPHIPEADAQSSPPRPLPSSHSSHPAANLERQHEPSPPLCSISLNNPTIISPALATVILCTNSMEPHYHAAIRPAFLTASEGQPSKSEVESSLLSLWPHWQWTWEAKQLLNTKFLIKFPDHADLDAICAVPRFSLSSFCFSLRRWAVTMGAVGCRIRARAWIKIFDIPILANNDPTLRGIIRHFGAFHRRAVSADEVIGPEEAVLLVDYGGINQLPRHMNLIFASLCFVLTIFVVEELPFVPLSTASLLKADLIPEPEY